MPGALWTGQWSLQLLGTFAYLAKELSGFPQAVYVALKGLDETTIK